MPKTSHSGPPDQPEAQGYEWGTDPSVPTGHFGPPQQLQMTQEATGEPCPMLCQEGPCGRYHEIKSLMDVQKPLDGSASPERFKITRTCYPHSGIEMDIDVPIVSCNRWVPLSTPSARSTGDMRTAFDLRVDEWAAKRAEDEQA